jgi:hypothetical protein
MDGTPEINLTNSGENDSALIIRCIERKTDAIVVTGGVVDNGYVRVKFDDSSASREAWIESSDHQGLFCPDAITFARRLAKSKSFSIEFKPFERVPKTLSFNVSGLEDRLNKIASACDWNAADKARARAAAEDKALRDRLSTYVHLCPHQDSELYAGKWCWSDPTGSIPYDSGLTFNTRDEALRDAIEAAKHGAAFRSDQEK